LKKQKVFKMRRLTKSLLENSIDAFALALSIINNPSVKYRIEAFSFLFCNAWELLIKAKLYEDRRKIFYRKERNKPKRSLSLDDCLRKVFTNPKDPIKENISFIADIRNNAIHFIIPFVPPDIMGLFQAGVINYAKKLNEWFNISISERIRPGMMALVYDFKPEDYSIKILKMKRKLPSESIKWIIEFQNRINKFKEGLEPDFLPSFHIPIEFTVALARNPQKADIILSPGDAGESKGIIITVPKDPSQTHPNRMKEVIEKVNNYFNGEIKLNQFDILAIRRVHNVEKRPEWFYKSKIKGHSPQYSDKFVNWIIEEIERDKNFIYKTRERYKKINKRRFVNARS